MGALQLYTDTDLSPREILDGFDAGIEYSLEVVYQGEGWDVPGLQGMTRFLCVVDCGLRLFCSECGGMMCPGCRRTALLKFTAAGPRGPAVRKLVFCISARWMRRSYRSASSPSSSLLRRRRSMAAPPAMSRMPITGNNGCTPTVRTLRNHIMQTIPTNRDRPPRCSGRPALVILCSHLVSFLHCVYGRVYC